LEIAIIIKKKRIKRFREMETDIANNKLNGCHDESVSKFYKNEELEKMKYEQSEDRNIRESNIQKNLIYQQKLGIITGNFEIGGVWKANHNVFYRHEQYEQTLK
jgi:hypothetical protein